MSQSDEPTHAWDFGCWVAWATTNNNSSVRFEVFAKNVDPRWISVRIPVAIFVTQATYFLEFLSCYNNIKSAAAHISADECMIPHHCTLGPHVLEARYLFTYKGSPLILYVTLRRDDDRWLFGGRQAEKKTRQLIKWDLSRPPPGRSQLGRLEFARLCREEQSVR